MALSTAVHPSAWSKYPAAKGLADIGISRDQSSRWLKLAAIDEDKFERADAAADRVSAERLVADLPTSLTATKDARKPSNTAQN